MLEHNNFREALVAEISELQQQKAKLIQNLKQALEGSLNVLEKAEKKPDYNAFNHIGKNYAWEVVIWKLSRDAFLQSDSI